MKSRAICLNCIDGRIHLPVIEWITTNYPVDYVDMITEPGMDKHLSSSENSLDHLNAKIEISITKNKSTRIFIVGHYDCRGNPVEDDAHKEQVRVSVSKIKSLFPKMEVFGLWVNSDWNCEQLM